MDKLFQLKLMIKSKCKKTEKRIYYIWNQIDAQTSHGLVRLTTFGCWRSDHFLPITYYIIFLGTFKWESPKPQNYAFHYVACSIFVWWIFLIWPLPFLKYVLCKKNSKKFTKNGNLKKTFATYPHIVKKQTNKDIKIF